MPHYTTVYAIEGHYPDGTLCYRYFASDSRTVDAMKEFLNCPAFRDVPPPTVRLLHYWEAAQLVPPRPSASDPLIRPRSPAAGQGTSCLDPDSVLQYQQQKEEDTNMTKEISINNGRTYCTPAAAIAALPWETIVNAMDDDTREAVAREGYDTPEEFLTAYLAAAPCDLIIG